MPDSAQRAAARLAVHGGVQAVTCLLQQAAEDAETMADAASHVDPSTDPHLAMVGGMSGLRRELQRCLRIIDGIEAAGEALR